MACHGLMSYGMPWAAMVQHATCRYAPSCQRLLAPISTYDKPWLATLKNIPPLKIPKCAKTGLVWAWKCPSPLCNPTSPWDISSPTLLHCKHCLKESTETTRHPQTTRAAPRTVHFHKIQSPR